MNRKKLQEWIKNFISRHHSFYKPAKYLITGILFFRLLGKHLCRKTDMEKIRRLMIFAAGSILVYIFIPYGTVKGLENNIATVSEGDSGSDWEGSVSGGDSGYEGDLPDSSLEDSAQGDNPQESMGSQESGEPEAGEPGQEEGTGEPEAGEPGQEEGTGEPEAGEPGQEEETGEPGAGESGQEEETGEPGAGEPDQEEGDGEPGAGESGQEEGTQDTESGDSEDGEEVKEPETNESGKIQEGSMDSDISSGDSLPGSPPAHDFRIPSDKDSGAVLGGDVSGNDILSVTVPSQGLITIDPYNILGKGQIISPDFQFTNHSDFEVDVELASVDYELKTQTWGNTVKNCELYWGTDESSISLWPGHSENLERFSLDRGSFRTYRFTGKLSENTESLWNGNDIRLNMVFRFGRTQQEAIESEKVIKKQDE